MANTLWINAKIMKVAYLIICISVLFFVFACLLSIPPSYIERLKKKGHHLSALSMLPNAPAWLSIWDYCRGSCDVEIILVRTLALLKVPRAVVKTTLQQVGVKVVHLTAHYQLCWYR